jgi:hypothetical protein
METPVLYFYTDKYQTVSVDVGFPDGIIAESYPKAVANYPLATDGVQFKNGFSHYEVNVTTEKDSALIPFTDSKNIYSHARNVQSNVIVSNNEADKFIFYRGLGDFNTQLKIKSSGGNFSITNTAANINSVFIVNFDGKQGGIKSIGNINRNQTITIDEKTINALIENRNDFKTYIADARNIILKALIQNGLYQDEAIALLDTWEQSYLKNPGLRVLYVLNREEVERILPMNITPAPEQLTRVFVGRIEVLTEKNENNLIKKIVDQNKNFKFESLGRLAHPILARLLTKVKATPNLKSQSSLFENLLNEAKN